MEIVALEAAMEINVVHKNPLPAFQIQFILMEKSVVCNVDWLMWMMSMLHDTVIVYTRENICGHDSTNRSELCAVRTVSITWFYYKGFLKQAQNLSERVAVS